jgi:hypothetical protein
VGARRRVDSHSGPFRTMSELLMDLEEDLGARAIVVGELRVMERKVEKVGRRQESLEPRVVHN